jgi:hypothetical protein
MLPLACFHTINILFTNFNIGSTGSGTCIIQALTIDLPSADAISKSKRVGVG